MPNTIGQHAVATFTSPVNGTTPIDANSVRGNDNTLRSSYNNHDADPGVHVQSSTLASRPAAGTAGRKWITADAGVYKLWYDDGTRWHEVGNDAIELAVVADEALVKGDVVSVTGFNNGLNVTRVAKYTGAAPAFGIAAEAIGNGSQGYVINTGIISDINTNAFGATGTVLYPAATGTFTSTKPTSGTYQVSAYVLRQNSTNGALYVEFSATRIVERSDNTVSTLVLRDASGNFAAGTITATLSGSITGNAATATALQTARTINGVSFNGSADITVTAAAGTLSGSTLASGVTASSLTSVGTLTSLAVSGTATVGKVSVTANTVTGNGMYLPTSNTLAFSTNDTERARIDVLGRFGLGVTPSAWVNRSVIESTYGGALSFDQVQVQTALSSNCFYDGTNWIYKLSSFAPTRYELGDAGTGDGTHRWSSAAAGTAGNTITFAERMRLDSSGNLGIGTASPAARLDVAGNGIFTVADAAYATAFNATTGNLRILPYVDGTQGSALIAYGAGYASLGPLSFDASQLRFYTGSTTRAIIDASGNLGLGVTPSAWASAAAGYSVMQIRNAAFYGISTNIARMSANAFVDSSGVNTYISNGFATRHDQVDGEFKWFTAPSGTAGNAISFTQAMTLDASGNLGVLDTAPQTSLNNFSASSRGIAISSGYPTIALSDTGNAAWQFFLAQDGGEAYVWNRANGPLIFAANNTERARIPAAGGMVVGTAALATSATDGFLYVPTCAGTPTGTPTTQTGTAPIIVDTTNHKLYFFSGGTWRDAGP